MKIYRIFHYNGQDFTINYYATKKLAKAHLKSLSLEYEVHGWSINLDEKNDILHCMKKGSPAINYAIEEINVINK
ncbi:MAG: hypothetical protein IKP65_03390 [Alphaproteobacteria bacterium]|nr:hypothetical protein [Alphaproteobacteria bacterium]